MIQCWMVVTMTKILKASEYDARVLYICNSYEPHAILIDDLVVLIREFKKYFPKEFEEAIHED